MIRVQNQRIRDLKKPSLLDLERKCLEVDMTNVLSSFESNIGHEPK